MQDLTSKREKFLQEAADCELIANLAADAKKRETFRNLALQLRKLANDLAAEMAKREVLDGAMPDRITGGLIVPTCALPDDETSPCHRA